MDWITNDIAVGNYLEALDVELLQHEKFASVLSLDGTLHGKVAAEYGLQRIEIVCLEDAPGNEPRLFRLAVDYLRELVFEAAPVLVQCHAGRSRSAVVVAGYLVVVRGFDPEAALRFVADKRQIAVTAGLERLLDFL